MKITTKFQLLLAVQVAGLAISCCLALWQSSADRSGKEHAYKIALGEANDDFQKYANARIQLFELISNGNTVESDTYWNQVLLPAEKKAVAAVDKLAAHVRMEAYSYDEQHDAVMAMASMWRLFVPVSGFMTVLMSFVLLARGFVQPLMMPSRHCIQR